MKQLIGWTRGLDANPMIFLKNMNSIRRRRCCARRVACAVGEPQRTARLLWRCSLERFSPPPGGAPVRLRFRMPPHRSLAARRRQSMRPWTLDRQQMYPLRINSRFKRSCAQIGTGAALRLRQRPLRQGQAPLAPQRPNASPASVNRCRRQKKSIDARCFRRHVS